MVHVIVPYHIKEVTVNILEILLVMEMAKQLMKENVYVIYLMMENIVNIQIMKHVMEMALLIMMAIVNVTIILEGKYVK